MISVKVTYTVKPEFVTRNLDNIRNFLADFQAMEDDFQYNVYLLEDGVTFLHISSYANLAVQEKVLSVVSFKRFQEKRDAEGGLDGSHVLEHLTFVGSSDVRYLESL